MSKKVVKQSAAVLISLLLCMGLIFGIAFKFCFSSAGADSISAFAAEDSNKVLYLSDTSRIKHDKSSFSLGNTRLWMAPTQVANIPNKVVQAKIEGAWYNFEYGVYAHANSIVAFDISNFSNEYKYFSAYTGLCNGASKSDGVLVRVDFSQDGKNWVTEPIGNTPATSTDGTQFVGYNQDFIHFTYDVT